MLHHNAPSRRVVHVIGETSPSPEIERVTCGLPL
jgi:hypothetical protein